MSGPDVVKVLQAVLTNGVITELLVEQEDHVVSKVAVSPTTLVDTFIQIPDGISDGEGLVWDESSETFIPGSSGGSVVEADADTQGTIKLTGDLGGTAEFPTVPDLVNKADVNITTGQPRYDVQGFGPSSTASERRSTLQAAVTEWALTGGQLNLDREWDISGGAVVLPSTPLGSHTVFEFIGSKDATLSTTSPHPLITDTVPADLNDMVNRANRRFLFRKLRLQGTRNAAQTLLKVIGSYGTEVDDCTFVNGYDGLDLIFALQPVIRNCKGIGNGGKSMRLRSATGVVSDATGSSSGTNCAHVSDWRDYCLTGQAASISLFEADGAVLENIITEGGDPVRGIDFDANSNTTVKSLKIDMWHDEHTPTDCALRVANLSGGVVKVVMQFAQTPHVLIDARNCGTSATIHVEDIPYLPFGIVPFRGDAFGAFWLFTGHTSGVNPLTPGLWVDGVVPNYAGSGLRPSGVGDLNYGGIVPVLSGGVIGIEASNSVIISGPSSNLNRLGQSTLRVPNVDSGFPYNPIGLYDSQMTMYQSETDDTLGIMLSKADGTRRDVIIPVSSTPISVLTDADTSDGRLVRSNELPVLLEAPSGSDDTDMINAALESGREVYGRTGNYLFTSFDLPNHPFKIRGQGGGLTNFLHIGTEIGLDIGGSGGSLRRHDGSSICDCTFKYAHASNSANTHLMRLVNVYNFTLDRVSADFNGSARGWSTAIIELISSGGNNSAFFTLRGGDLKLGVGDALRITGGAAVVVLEGGYHLNANAGFGVNCVDGPVELHMFGGGAEGNTLGSVYADSLIGSSIMGTHFEHGGGNGNAHISLGLNGSFSGVDIMHNIFGGDGTAQYALDCNGAGGSQRLKFVNNDINGFSVAGARLRCVLDAEVDNTLTNCPAQKDLVNFNNQGIRLPSKDGLVLLSRGQVNHAPNFGLQTELFGGGKGVIAIGNSEAVPTTPIDGGIFFIAAGALKYMGSSGTVTTIAPA